MDVRTKKLERMISFFLENEEGRRGKVWREDMKQKRLEMHL